MNKCKWKGGEYKQCNRATAMTDDWNTLEGLDLNFRELFRHVFKCNDLWYPDFCPFCGADTRKPEPKVIIKKSGGTWVKREDGIDYLWMRPELPTSCNTEWKPISEIKITDEIALLRPLIISVKHGKGILLGSGRGLSETQYVVDFVREYDSLVTYDDKIRLATVKDI